MDTDSEMVENIKACRTCGIHYVTPSKNQLKHLFQSAMEASEIMLIRLELTQWNVEVAENDGFPQYVCNTCIHKFEQVFALRTACINAQNDFRKFYAVPNGNVPNVKIKTEILDASVESPSCDFIYVDDLSDTEYESATPFNFPHIPIKAELIEAAAIPMEESEQPTNIVESASGAVVQTGPSSLHIPDYMAQNESIAASQPSAVEQETVDIECKLCQHISSNEEEHKQHLQRAHEVGDFECHICGKEFKSSTPSRLKFHMKWHTLYRRVKCTICGLVCNSKDTLREHKRTNHSKLNCNICGKGVLAKRMKSHIRQHELILKYSCEYCTKAFATEDERENHIWQIHANEDNNATTNPITPFQTNCTQTASEGTFMSEESFCQKADQAIIYKFICAHCELRFIEQTDLETHVKKEHLAKPHLISVEPEAVNFVEKDRISKTTEIVPNEQIYNEHANITVFEEYDDNDQIQVAGNNNSSINNTPILTQNFSLPPSTSDFVSQTENVLSDETETASNASYEESDAGESENETNSNLPSYAANNVNTFACAKCTETFATIEQLRQHHVRHLAADQQQQLTTPSPKSKFKCNLCGKLFDLKFSLNRHIKKHKNAPL